MTTSILLPFPAEFSTTILAVAELPPSDHTALRLAALIGLTVLHAVFAAAESALIKVHESQFEESEAKHPKRSEEALGIVKNTKRHLVSCQLAMGFCTLAIGAIGVPWISQLLGPLLIGFGASGNAITIISFLVAMIVFSFLHVLFGEQIPKAIGLANPVKTVFTTTYSLRAVHLLLLGPIWLIDFLSDLILKRVFRIRTGNNQDLAPTANELRLLVEATGRSHEVTETEQEILKNALELNELCVRDILTPRNEVVVLDVHKTFKENLDEALESKHTRFPLVDGHLDKTLGLIHIKDLLREMHRDSMNLFAVKRDLMRVSEMLPLDEMLKLFLAKRAHIALVVDEFGGSVGLVMLDDVLDQVVGEIYDEFDDEEEEGFHRVSETEFQVEGWFPLHELSDQVEDLTLEDPDVSTVGGYIISHLGRIPEEGETVVIDDYEIEIIAADERTVQKIRFSKKEVMEADKAETEPIVETAGAESAESKE